ncbi:alpha/beta hydrolase [Cellulomonas fimi]|uniref:Alpha/beta hydrolase n=1 Tax=Cellulomonas fimi TaxID=1708 RepID=A0A7Y0LX17_CELFI|nr:alpha/beta hydrolase [Cellulomonas fimi]NMR18943.1 alpha/beta hydrolase [Cellulomonas fimi]
MTAPTAAALDTPGTVAGAVSHRGITYAELRGFRPLLMDVHVPSSAAGPVPCVLWIHGGGWEAGDRRFTPANWPGDALFEALVASGLAVATADYRLSSEARFPAAVHDVKAALRFLRSHASVLSIAPDRIGVSGESAGGHLAAMLALTADDLRFEGDVGEPGPSTAVQAAALLYPVTDFFAELRIPAVAPERLPESPEVRFLGATPEQAPGVARTASPMSHAGASAPPTLLISGDQDAVVPLEQSERLHAALVAAGAPDVVLEVVPGADHCFEGVDPVPPLRTVVEFLADRLGA